MPGEDRMPKGPRHAAPKKPLLNRLPLSGGRIAFMAMPSALLLGVGLTPQLAQAQPGGQNPFREGPCVSAPDQDPEAEDDARDGKDEKQDGKDEKETGDGSTADKPERDGGTSGGDTGGGKDSGDGESTPEKKPTPSPDKPENKPDEEPEPEPSRNPLDPLGIGDKLRDLFNPNRDKAEDDKAKDDKAKDADEESPEARKLAEKKAAEAKKKAAEAEKKAEAVKEKAEQAAKEAAEQAKKERAEKQAEDAAKADEDGSDPAGKKPFPCPEFDKEAFDGAEHEETPVTVPDEAFKLNTTRLGLAGLKYHGIVKVRTQGGTEKRVLKFTADRIDIKDLHQVVVGPGGRTQHIRSQAGSTSTFRDGTVTMYTEELDGKLFGLIPVTFSPETPPPLDIPAAVFTDAVVTQAGQFGGTLKVPGLRLSME